MCNRKMMIFLTIFGYILLFNTACFSEMREPTNKNTSLELSLIKNDIKYLTKSIEQVKTDQLNYKTEKELLKDAYSSSFQTINIILTIILAIFGFIGYVGIKDIYALKLMYNTELTDIKNIKENFEKELRTLTREQARNKVVNKRQSKQLEIIEIKEQIFKKIEDGSYTEALVLIDKALSLKKDNASILLQKVICYEKMNQLHEAIKVSEKMLELDNDDYTAIVNLCEFYLLTNQIGKYDSLFSNNYVVIKNLFSNEMIDYLNTIKSFNVDNTPEFYENIKNVLCYYRPGIDTRLKKWDFGSVERFIESQSDSKKKSLFKDYISVLRGKKDPSELALNCADNIAE